MKIAAIRHHSDRIAAQAFLKRYVPPSDGAEMVRVALDSGAKYVRVALDDRGIAGAIAYDLDGVNAYVYALGSISKGAGTHLMNHVEREAAKRKLDVRLAAVKSAVEFYRKRGYHLLEDKGSVRSMIKLI